MAYCMHSRVHLLKVPIDSSGEPGTDTGPLIYAMLLFHKWADIRFDSKMFHGPVTQVCSDNPYPITF